MSGIDETVKPMACPHCGETLSVNIWATAAAEHRLSFSLSPKPGELIDAKTFGGLLRSTARLLQAVGKEMGTDTQVLLERVETTPDGQHIAHVLVARSRLGAGLE